MNIAEAIPKDNYMLYIKCEDVSTGLFDVKPYLKSEVFSPLKDKIEFERFYNGKYYSADTIRARWNPFQIW